jgi:uncharacterized protein (TIGR02444 family)
MTAQAGRDLWAYSLRVYGKPGIKPLLLDLQDSVDADVNMLLYCCWLGQKGLVLERNMLEAAIDAVRDWRTRVIQPLRSVRRTLSGDVINIPADQLAVWRSRLLEQELDAEQVEVSMLAGYIPDRPDADEPSGLLAACCANLHSYLSVLAGRGKNVDQNAVIEVIGRVCDVDKDAVQYEWDTLGRL